MKKDVAYTFKHTAIYGLSNLLVKLAGLILLPIYTTQFTTDEFGIVVILEIVAQFLVGVVSLNLPQAILRIGSDTKGLEQYRRVYSTGVNAIVIICALFLAVFLPFSSTFSGLFFNTSEHANYFVVIGLSVVVEIFSLAPLSLIRLQRKPFKYVFFFSLKLASLVGFTWYFVVLHELGIIGVLQASLIANGIVGVCSFLSEIRFFRAHFDREVWQQLYKFGAPLVFTTVAGLLLTLSDRIIIKLFGEYSEVGVYGLAYKLGSISNLLVIGTFSLGFLPIAFNKFHDADFKRFFSQIFTLFIGLISILTLLVSLFSREFIHIISRNQPDYWLAILLVPVIAFSFVFKGFQAYFGFTYLLTKKTKYQARITIIGVFLNIALNFMLIPFFDIYGAIAATGMSYIFMSIYSYRIAQKQLQITYNFKTIWTILFATGILIVIGMTTTSFGIITSLSIKLGLLAIFAALLYKLVVNDRMKREFKVMLKTFAKKKNS